MNHPNIVSIYDLPPPKSNSYDEIFIVMELCDSDLKKLIKQPVNLEATHIQSIMYSIFVGLKYLHSAGVYHRDLKPANVLVNQDCTVKIADFGLSRAVDVDDHAKWESVEGEVNANEDKSRVVPHNKKMKNNLTKHVVTRWYRAPELILLSRNYNQQIDVWSCGCIFGEVLQMLVENKVDSVERGPLFPGRTCFPLSPHAAHEKDYKFHINGGSEMLNVIFDLVGTPTPNEISLIEKEEAQRYVKAFESRKGKGLKKQFPGTAWELDIHEAR